MSREAIAFFENENIDDDEIFAIIDNDEALSEMRDFMDDEYFDSMLFFLMKIYKKPDLLNSDIVVKVLNRLQALSGLLAVRRNYFKTIGKADRAERYKKDNYYTAVDALDKLVNSLKYQAQG